MTIRQLYRSLALAGALGAAVAAAGAGTGRATAATGAGRTAAAGAEAGAAALRERVRAYRLHHEKEIVQELATFSSLRNVARDRADIVANADALAAMLKRRGLTARKLEAAGSPPAVYAELSTPGARRTVVFYAHYDGQPADAADWHGDPWKPVLRTGPLPAGKEVDLASAPSPLPAEWRLFARAASDDKGPIVGMLTALDALRAAGIAPSVNLKFFFEGEEEAGSPHLGAILRQYRELLAADAWVLCDGPEHQSRRFQVVFGARGYTGLQMTLYGPSRPLHSGHYGNWAPNPAALLAQVLASMRGPDGEILIQGFAQDVRPLSASEHRAAAALPPVEDDLRRELAIGWTEGKGERLQELVMRPALNVIGLRSAQVGPQAHNAIPTEATVAIDFRLVPDQTPERVHAQVEEHLRHLGFFIVHGEPDAAARLAHGKVARLEWVEGYPGARTAMDLPASRAVVEAVEEGLGKPVLQVPMLGGSIPIYLFGEIMKAPVIAVPTVNYDNSQHAADENLRLQNLWDGIEVFAALFARLDKDWK
ncbi:MAG TPA: M20/M25/M40 family metallo-hydrolase [Thermoanaerobaculia bacterium]|nr:M20/M25/M40 family metallo-hydrolase [Thermoanaerobaculia bacterium]